MFSSIFHRNKKENKALLEHKLYLAKETPETIFDLSECDINNVPTGIYSLCKVFRKEILNLANNNLQSLNGGGKLADLSNIVVLNLNNNAFSSLPFEIQLLHSLKELYLEGNQLKKLPFTICTLGNLEILNVNNNDLRELPNDLGLLFALQSLWLKSNPKLLCLPSTLHKAHQLSDIQLDVEVITYPPVQITSEGSEAILKFICLDKGCNCFENKSSVDGASSPKHQKAMNAISSYSSNIEAKIWNLEKIKEQKQKDFLAIEREWDKTKQQELDVANSQKVDKDKLLAELSYQQGQLNDFLDKIQLEKDQDRFKLVEQLRETEYIAGQAIQQLLHFNTKPPPQLFDQEVREHEELLRAANEHKDIKKAQILNEMKDLLENETNKFKQIDQSRIETTKSILNQEVETNSHLLEVLESIENRSKELTNTLQEDSELQKMAVAALLEKSDVRSWSLVQQVMLVESQLAALTNIEIDRRKLQVDQNLNDLAQQRVELSNVLLDLLEQQNTRRGQLMSTLQSLEAMNQEQADDFWFRQYKTLLDRMPEGLIEMQKNVNPQFVEALLMEGVLNYLPLLAKLPQNESLTQIDEEDLANLGITNQNDRERILRAFRRCDIYKGLEFKPSAKEVETVAAVAEDPSAPDNSDEEEFLASAPRPNVQVKVGVAELECVICMDERCQVVYIPCGHYCSCYNCSVTITDCPMCRAQITRIIRVD